MPELPDLEVFSRNLNKALAGKTVKKVKVNETGKLNVPESKLKKSLEGQPVTRVYREGKELYFKFGDETILSLHLMLHGKLYFFEESNPHKHTIIELLFEDGSGLALTDFQRLATPTLNPGPGEGQDALSPGVNLAFLKEQLSGTKATVKNFLLDQHIIRGIGNAYADEILWDARISPFSICNKIPDPKIKDLLKSIKKVLQDAEKQIVKTKPDIISGEFRDFLNVHNAKKTHSPTGEPIRKKVSNSRKTYYTDEQELFK